MEERREIHRETMASWIEGHTDCMSIVSDSEIDCKVCKISLQNAQKSHVQRHLLKHTQKLDPFEADNFSEELCEALMAANITFNKPDKPTFNTFLQKYTGRNVPDESTLRKYYVYKCYTQTWFEALLVFMQRISIVYKISLHV